MSRKRIGALTIGQSPRPDLIAPLENLLSDCEILQVGALDDLTPDDLPKLSNAAYPLTTQMRNGNTILVGEGFITTKLQQALIQLEANGVIATLLLCTGTFSGLQGTYPLFIPFKIGCSHLSAHQMHSIGLITPIAAQEVPIRARWAKMGWQPTVWTADLGMQDKAFHRQLTQKIRKYGLECIVLDYFGHPSVQVNQLQKSVEIPVIDLGHLAMVTLANSL